LIPSVPELASFELRGKMKHSLSAIVAALACMTFMPAPAALSQPEDTLLTERPEGKKGSACDRAYTSPPFFDTDTAPILAFLKKETRFGNVIIPKGYPLYILEIRDTRACILVHGPSGLSDAWVDAARVKAAPGTFTPVEWHGRWHADGKLTVADNSHLPEWAQRVTPRQTRGSEGEITISASNTGDGTVRVVGDKTILSARNGEKFSAHFEGTGRILGPMLIFDEARSANRAMTTDDCLVVMLTDAPGRIQINSYGRCADNAVHYDGPYRQTPIASKAN
jgi:hypothetical protein